MKSATYFSLTAPTNIKFTTSDSKKVITCKVKAGEKGRIFGSVTSQEIANSLVEQGYEVEKRMILLSDPIKSLGHYNVEIKLMSGVIAKIVVKVESL